MGCKVVLKESDLEEGRCPVCNTKPEKMCSLDKVTCSHPSEDMSGLIDYCPECGRMRCPICGCHDVMCLSRITGYIQDVTGFNAAKAQEVKDRTHYQVT
jgi:hypothetical protein